MALFGLASGLNNLLNFPRTYARFGPKKVFMTGLAVSFILELTFPIIHRIAVAGEAKDPGGPLPMMVWVMMGFMILVWTILDFSFGQSMPRLSLSA